MSDSDQHHLTKEELACTLLAVVYTSLAVTAQATSAPLAAAIDMPAALLVIAEISLMAVVFMALLARMPGRWYWETVNPKYLKKRPVVRVPAPRAVTSAPAREAEPLPMPLAASC